MSADFSLYRRLFLDYTERFRNESQMQSLIDDMKKGAYREYLMKVLEERHELY